MIVPRRRWTCTRKKDGQCCSRTGQILSCRTCFIHVRTKRTKAARLQTRDLRQHVFQSLPNQQTSCTRYGHAETNPPARTQAAQALEILSFAYTRCKKHFTRIVRRHTLTRQMRNAWPGSMDTKLGTCRTQHICALVHSCKQNFVSKLFAQLCRVTARGNACVLLRTLMLSVFFKSRPDNLATGKVPTKIVGFLSIEPKWHWSR